MKISQSLCYLLEICSFNLGEGIWHVDLEFSLWRHRCRHHHANNISEVVSNCSSVIHKLYWYFLIFKIYSRTKKLCIIKIGISLGPAVVLTWNFLKIFSTSVQMILNQFHVNFRKWLRSLHILSDFKFSTATPTKYHETHSIPKFCFKIFYGSTYATMFSISWVSIMSICNHQITAW